MRNTKRIFYTFTTIILVYFIYRISVLLLMVGLEGASREIFFITLSLYLFLPLLKNIKLKKNVSSESEIIKKMKNVYKGIKDEDTTALIGLTLKEKNIVIDIDSIIINKYGVFNIVFCDYRGNIIIKEYNCWVNEDKKGYEVELESPVNKIRKNRELLNKVFEEDQIIDLIVMVNDRIDVIEEESSSIPIVRYDDLVYYLNEYYEEELYDSEELYNKLYPLIYKEKDLNKEIDYYEKYLDNKWQYRSRVAVISFSLFFYILKVIEFK